MQVEVCIQDCYTSAGSDALDHSLEAPLDTPSPFLVSAETWEIWFQRWFEALQPGLSPIQAYELSLRLTSDRDMQRLNAQYRHQDKPTDVLAFATLEADCPQADEALAVPLYLGDIIISVDTAQSQALSQGHNLETELAWLATHGLLHLLGWDHPDEASLMEMLTQQKALLNTVGVSIRDS